MSHGIHRWSDYKDIHRTNGTPSKFNEYYILSGMAIFPWSENLPCNLRNLYHTNLQDTPCGGNINLAIL